MAGRRTVKIEILGDAKGAQGAFGSADKAADGFGSKIGGIAKGIGVATAAIGVAIGAAAIVGIKAASDYEESFNKVGEVFDDQAGRITDWSKNAAQSFGLSRSEALAAAGDFGNLFTAMGIGTGSAADMSEGIVGLAADLGSFNNIGTDEALEKIRAGLVGETEPLRSLGVNLDAASIKAKAMAMGLADASGELTPAAKAQAAYALILEQTTNAQGDFQRTKSGMANSLKVIGASFDDVKVAIGQRLLPAVAPLIAAFAARLPAALDIAVAWFDRIIGVVKGPLMAVFTLIRDGWITLFQALSGDWQDNDKIVGLHRVLGNVGLVIREQIIPAVQSMAAWFTGTLLPAIQTIIGFVGQLTAAFGEGGFAGVVALLAERLGPVAEQLMAWAGQVLVQLVGKIGQWAGAFLDWIAPMIPPLLVELAKVAAAIGTWAYETALPAIREQLGVWGQALIDWIGPRIGPLVEALGTLLSALGSWMLDTALPAIAAKLGEWGAAFVAWVGPQIPPLLAALGGLLADLGGWLLSTALPAIIEKLGQWGAAFIAWVAPQIPPLLVALGGLLVDLGAWMIGTALPEIVRKLAQWGAAFIGWVATEVLPKLPGALAEILTTIGGWIAGVAGDLASEGAKIGLAILSGIGSAIRDGASSIVKSAIDSVAGLIPSWARKALGISSPSKVMRDMVGLPIAQGIASGILAGVDDIDEAMRWINRHIWEQSQPQLAMNPTLGNRGRLNPVGAGRSRDGSGRVRDGGNGAGSGRGLGGRAITLVMPSGQMVGQWYAGYQAGEDALAPVGIGGLV